MQLLMDFGANIFIASAGTYFIFKLIPYQKNREFQLWRKVSVIFLILLTNFLLMYFAYELPDGVRIDFRYVAIILITISSSGTFTLCMALLIGLSRFWFGDIEVARQALFFIMLFTTIILFWRKLRHNKIHEFWLIIELMIVCSIVNFINASFFYGVHPAALFLAFVWSLFSVVALLLLYGVLYDVRRTRELYILEIKRAHTDTLTNLANRRAFDEQIQLFKRDKMVQKLNVLMLGSYNEMMDKLFDLIL